MIWFFESAEGDSVTKVSYQYDNVLLYQNRNVLLRCYDVSLIKGGIMAREDIIMLSSKEMRRVKIINEVLDKHMTQVAAGEFLSLSDRQVRRIGKRLNN